RRRPGVHRASGRLDHRLQRRDARGTLALQPRHAAQGFAGDLRDRAEAVSRRAVERPAPASGQVRQPAALELSVRVLAELKARGTCFKCKRPSPLNAAERGAAFLHAVWRKMLGTATMTQTLMARSCPREARAASRSMAAGSASPRAGCGTDECVAMLRDALRR